MEEVWGFAEVVEYADVSRQQTAKLVNRPDFPAPVQVLASGRLWLADEVREYFKRRRARYPGPIDSDEL